MLWEVTVNSAASLDSKLLLCSLYCSGKRPSLAVPAIEGPPYYARGARIGFRLICAYYHTRTLTGYLQGCERAKKGRNMREQIGAFRFPGDKKKTREI